MKYRAASLALILLLGSSTVAAAADALAALPSYRASFKMSLVKNNSDSSIQGADGQMFFEWKRACGGYNYVQQSYTDYVSGDGEIQRQELESDSFESTDGTAYTFHFIDRMDGVLVEEFEGQSTLSPDGKGGMVDYSKPTPADAVLPEGTIFPTIFTLDILNAARAGKHFASRRIFDGMGDDALYDAIAFIGEPRTDTGDHDSAADPNGLLKGQRWWNVSIAFYSDKTSDGLPDYEMSARFYENGITTDLLFDYGDIIMRGDLQRVEPAANETCGSSKKR